MFALVQAIDRQSKQMEQLTQAINQLAASNESLVGAILDPEPESDESEEHGYYMDGSRSQ